MLCVGLFNQTALNNVVLHYFYIKVLKITISNIFFQVEMKILISLCYFMCLIYTSSNLLRFPDGYVTVILLNLLQVE